MPRALVLKVADRLTDHPSREVVQLQRVIMLVLIDTTFTLVRAARRLTS